MLVWFDATKVLFEKSLIGGNMKKTVVLVFALLIFCTGIANSQVEDERMRQEREDRIQEVVNDAQRSMSPPYLSFVAQLLPAAEGAWMVSIGRQGGFAGNTSQLIAAMNSEAVFACGAQNQSFLTQRLDLSLADPIGTMIAGSDLKSLKKQFASDGSHCSDCYTYSMEVIHRDKKKARSYLFEWSVFPESSPGVRSIYDSVLSTTGCS